MSLITSSGVELVTEGGAPQPVFTLRTRDFDRAIKVLRLFPPALLPFNSALIHQFPLPPGVHLPRESRLWIEFSLDDAMPGNYQDRLVVPDAQIGALAAANTASRRLSIVLQEEKGFFRKTVGRSEPLHWSYAPYVLDWSGGLGVSVSARSGRGPIPAQMHTLALEGLQKQLAEHGYVTGLYTEIGMRYRLQEDWDQAIHCYVQEIVAGRTAAGGPGLGALQAFCNLGVVAKKLGDLQRARESFGIALGLNPNYFEALVSISGILEDTDLALNCVSRALRIRSDDPVFHTLVQAMAKAGVGGTDPAVVAHAVQVRAAQLDITQPLPGLPGADPTATDLWQALFSATAGAERPPVVRRGNGDRAALLALVGQFRQLFDQCRYAEAAPVGEQIRTLARTALGEHEPVYARMVTELAVAYDEAGDYRAAEPIYREALAIRRATVGEGHEDYAGSLNNLGELYRKMGRFAEAEALLGQAADVWRRTVGEEHPHYAIALDNLAGVYKAQANYAAAEPILCQALAITRKAGGPAHADYIISLNNLAILYREMARYAEAEPLARQALEAARQTFGADHPQVAVSLITLGEIQHMQGNYAAAEPFYEQARAIWGTAVGEAHPLYAACLHNLAELHRAAGNYATAMPLARRALDIRRLALGEDHPLTAASRQTLEAIHRAVNN
ncbi:MAG TPA: tetratricopeptide repeat protein [Chloroflexia bacterium]|nr:tetratricopeptide repeat protein [Chloroflexia bacterium]